MSKRLVGINPATGKSVYEYTNDDPELKQKLQSGIATPTTYKPQAQAPVNDLPNYNIGVKENAVKSMVGGSDTELPNYQIGTPQPTNLASTAGDIAGATANLIGKGANALFPSTIEYGKNYIKDIGTVFKGTPEEKAALAKTYQDPRSMRDLAQGPIASEVTRDVGKLIGQDWGSPMYEKQRPVYGEIAPWLLAGPGFSGLKGASVATKLAKPALFSGAGGFVHGFTRPDQTLGQGVVKGAEEGVTSAAIASALSGLTNVVAPWVGGKLKEAGTGLARRVIRPNVVTNPNAPPNLWSQKEAEASKTMLDLTGKSLTPQSIGATADSKRIEIGKAVIERLKDNPKFADYEWVTKQLAKAYEKAGLTTEGMTEQEANVLRASIDQVNRKIMAKVEPASLTPIIEDTTQVSQKALGKAGEQLDDVVAKLTGPTQLPAVEVDRNIKIAQSISESTEKQIMKLRALKDAGKLSAAEYTDKMSPLRALADRASTLAHKAQTDQQKLLETAFKAYQKGIREASTLQGQAQVSSPSLFEVKNELMQEYEPLMAKQIAGTITKPEAVKLKAYFVMKDLVDTMSPGTSYLTGLQSQLRKISEGSAKAVGTVGGSNLLKTVSSATLQPALMALSKGMYNVGKAGIPGTENNLIRALVTLLSVPKGK